MTEFSKRLTANINNKGTECLYKLVVIKKSDTFVPIPEAVNVTTLGV